MMTETALPAHETTAGQERPVDLDIRVSASSLLAESMTSAPFESFFVSTRTLERDHDFGFAPPPGLYTPLLDEEYARGSRGWRPMVPQAKHDRFEKANSDRVALLARKYVAKEQRFGDEESARLAILTERVRRLLPSVTAREYEVLEGALKVVNQVMESDAEIRRRLGLKRRA